MLRPLPHSSILALGVVCTAAGCGALVHGTTAVSPGKSPSERTAAPAAAVTWTRPVPCDYTPAEEFTGQIQAHKTVQLRARVSGYLNKIFFVDGNTVADQDELFQIDPRPFQAAVDKAEANTRQAQARLDRLNLQYTRAQGLVDTDAITREEFERIAADRNEAQAGLQAASVDQEIAAIDLGFTLIKSPLTGWIGQRAVDEGNLIKADDTLLATIMVLDPVYAYFEIDERTAIKFSRAIAARAAADQEPLSTKQKIKLLLIDQVDAPVHGVIEFDPPEVKGAPPILRLREPEEGAQQAALEGMIDYVEGQLDAGTGTMRVRATVENKNGLLTPGYFIRCRLPMDERQSGICVPEEALGSDQGQRFLFVLQEDGKIDQRRVELGPLLRVTAGDGLRANIRKESKGKQDPGKGSLSWRVIRGGLASDERVIVSNLQRVRVGENDKVQFKEEPKYIPPAGRTAADETAGAAVQESK